MEIIPYNKYMHQRLRDFLVSVYPDRQAGYIDWWLNGMDNIKDDWICSNLLLMHNDRIIGCTTAQWGKICIDGKLSDFHWEANTVIDKDFRKMGGGKLLYFNILQSTNRISTGYTSAGFSASKKFDRNFTPILSVKVYLTLNRFLPLSFLSGRTFMAPMAVNRFERVTDIHQIKFPNKGLWQGERIEIARTEDYFKSRFCGLYRDYYIYHLVGRKWRSEAYFVIRPTVYKGLRMLSLVDFRFTDKKHINDIIVAVNKIARKNRIGITITLTSLELPRSGIPLTIKTYKKLLGSTSIPGINERSDILITSADSDLDFVYYP